MILVDLDRVAVRHGDRPLFADLSVTVSTGDRLGVVGLNGTGKSTLLDVMAGATVPRGEPEAAMRALAAGCDMLLYPAEPEVVAAALDDDDAHEPSVARREAFLERIGVARDLGMDEAARSGGALLREADGRAKAALERAAARAVALAGLDGGARQELLANWPLAVERLLILVDDDGIEDRGDVLAAEAASSGVGAGFPWRIRAPELVTSNLGLKKIVFARQR